MMSNAEQITRECVFRQTNREYFVEATILQLKARLEGRTFSRKLVFTGAG